MYWKRNGYILKRPSFLVKEQWIPLLEHLISHENVDVTEAWCIDWYLYGDSLSYNKDFVMETPNTGRVNATFDTTSAYNRTTVNLRLCGQILEQIMETSLIPWKNRRMVFIGHSAGVYPLCACLTCL